MVGIRGNASNQLNNPYGIALHPTSNTLYISDFYNYRLMAYPSGVTTGSLLLGDQGPGTNNTQLHSAVGLYFDSFSNSLIIANLGANNVVRYTLGASSWTLVAGGTNGSSGTGARELTNPIDITLDPMGNVYVVDRGNSRIQFFSAGAVDGTTIAGTTGVNGNSTKTFNVPWAVRLDSQLNMYVADTANHRIQKFLRY